MQAIVDQNTDLPVTDIVHFKLSEGNWEKHPEFGGSECVIYRSPDGKRVAAAWKESGTHTFEYPFDEFVYVISGSGVASVRGGKTYHIQAGDVVYVKEGTVIDFDMSEDFMDVTFLVSDQSIKWR